MRRTGAQKSNFQGNPESPRLLPLKDAAAALGITVWAMREQIWAGNIPVVKFPGGRKQFVDTHDIEDFITRHKDVIQ